MVGLKTANFVSTVLVMGKEFDSEGLQFCILGVSCLPKRWRSPDDSPPPHPPRDVALKRMFKPPPFFIFPGQTLFGMVVFFGRYGCSFWNLRSVIFCFMIYSMNFYTLPFTCCWVIPSGPNFFLSFCFVVLCNPTYCDMLYFFYRSLVRWIFRIVDQWSWQSLSTKFSHFVWSGAWSGHAISRPHLSWDRYYF